MSLINKMLQDLDKRHAADAGGKTLTQQLRPVQTRRDWKRIAWEVGLGLIVAGGWAGWVLYQVSPRSVVTELAFQLQAKRPQLAAGAQAPAGPQAQQPLAPAPAAAPPGIAPAMAPATEAATAAAAPAATSPGLPASKETVPPNAEMLKLATEIGTPINEKSLAVKPKAERRVAAEAAPAPPKAGKADKPIRLQSATEAPAKTATPKTQGAGSIDKTVRLATPPERAEEEFRKATALLNQGRVAEAIDGYKSSLQQNAAHAAARQALVGLLLESRRIDEAQQFLQQGLSLDPNRSAYAILLARIQVERGDLQGAHDLLNKHAGSAAGDADYHAFDAALLQRLGRHKEAVDGYQAALKLAPRAGLWWMGMGISLQAEKRDGEALEAFRQAKSAGGLSPALIAFVDQRLKQLQ